MQPTEIKTDPSALTEIAARALQAMRRGDKRISVRKIMEAVRADLKVSVNNNDQTAITDRLIANQPQLANLIETRTRGTRGKNKAANDTTAHLTSSYSSRSWALAAG